MKIKVMLLFCVVVATATASQKEQVRVISVEYPPYTSKHMDGYGNVTRLLSEYAADNLAVDVIPRFVPPARAHKIIQDGDWCLSTYPPKRNAKKARFVPLSNEKVILTLIRLTKNEAFEWQQLSDLEGGVVAIMRTKTQSLVQKEITNSGLKLVYVGTVEQGLSMLLKRRVDFVFGDKNVILNTKVGQENKKKLQISNTSLYEANIGFFYNIDCEAELFGSTPP